MTSDHLSMLKISAIEFKQQRISILNHDSVIFTSKNLWIIIFVHLWKMRLRVQIQQIFCVSEAIARVKILSPTEKKDFSLENKVLNDSINEKFPSKFHVQMF